MKNFKFGAILLVLIFGFSSAAVAAPRVELKSPDFSINYLSGSDQVTAGALISGSLLISSTLENATTGYASADIASYSLDGIKQWDLPISNESIAGPIAKDATGNIYVLGATVSANTAAVPAPTQDPTVLNPDNVQTDPVTTPNNIISNLTIWKISSTGTLQQSFVLPINEAVIPKSITPNVNGFTIGANTKKQYLQVGLDLNGTFGTVLHPKQPKDIDLAQDFKLSSGKLKFFISTKSIVGIPSWKPKKPTPVLIQYSKFGQIKAANYFQGSPKFIFFQPSTGVIVGTELTSGFGITIVKPLK